jgi:hypothetical protein
MKRWVIRAIVCLLLGAATTVAVAWGHAALIDGYPEEATAIERGVTRATFPLWTISMVQQRGSTVIAHIAVDSTRTLPEALGLTGATAMGVERWMRLLEAADIVEGAPSLNVLQVPRWSRTSVPPTVVANNVTCFEDARGWPFRAMVSYHDAWWVGWRTTPLETPIGNSWRLDLDGTQGPLGLPLGLPLKPIGTGFMADTFLYALVWWGLFLGFAGAKRGIRRARGRCPMCGYDLRGALENGCSECGWGRSP